MPQLSAYLQVQEKQLELETVTQALAAESGRIHILHVLRCLIRVPAQLRTCKCLCHCVLKTPEVLQSKVEDLQKQAILFWHALFSAVPP